MMKRLLFAILVIGITTSIWAEPISREQALRQAQQFLLQKGKSKVLVQAETSMSKARAKGGQIPDYYYVFNAGQNEGFVIVSGDDRAVTVLGYSDKGSFDVDRIPSNMAAWLAGYEVQIMALQENGVSGSRKGVSKAPYASVAPIVQVHWDQNSPYNMNCWLDLPGYHINAPTGCVATAMAQAMSVYQYPSATTAEIPAYIHSFHQGDASYDAIPANTPIDWANLDVVNYNGSEADAKKEAIANLMSYCGRSVEMLYNGGGSSASVSDVPHALKTYFGYGTQVAYKKRNWSSSAADWNAMIYNEVAAGRPVIYGGQTAEEDGEGHAFIVDGYDGGGDAFHINWGWGQLPVSSDGYYKLSALDPDHVGTGGANGAYNFDQEAVIGIDKVSTGVVEEVNATVVGILFDADGTSAKAAIQNDITEMEYARNSSGYAKLSLYFQFQNHLADTYDFNFGMGIHKDGSLMGDIISVGDKNDLDNNTTYTTGWSTYWFGNGLANGSYEIKAYSKQDGASEWKLCENAEKQTIYVTVTANSIKFSKATSSEEPEPEPEVSDADRAELASVYATLKASVETKQASVTANETQIAALKASVTEKTGQIAALKTKITAIGEKLKNDLLTEEQKAYYTEQLSSLSDWCDQTELDVNDFNETIASLESSNAALKTQLATLSGTIDTQAAAVSGITTAEELAASTNMANTLKTQVDGCDVTTVTNQIATVKTGMAEVSVAEIDASIKEMDAEIDATIEEAQKAAEEKEKEQKEKEQLEAEKATLKAALDELKKTVDEKMAEVAANEQNLATLKAAIATAQEAVKPIDTKIAAIQEKLKSTYLTDAQKTDYTAQLTALEAEKATYSTALTELSTKLQDISGTVTTLNTQLADIAKAIQEQTAAIDGISSKDALETAKTKAAEVKTQLEGVNPASVSNDLNSLKTALAGLSLDSTSTALATLESAIDKAIADAIAAAQSEQEKEELDAAKKEVQASLDVVKTKLAEAKDKIAKGEAALAELAAAIKKGGETLVALKAKAVEIEALLAPSSVRTRSDLSDDQRAAYVKQLEALNAKIKTLEETLSALTAAESNLEAKVQEAKDLVQNVENGISSTETSLSTAATADAANALKATVAELETKLATIDTTANQVLTDITTQDSEVSAFEAEASAATEDATAIIEDVQNAISGIESLTIDENDIYGRYDLNGQRVDENYKGVMIIKMKNGKSQTIIKRK